MTESTLVEDFLRAGGIRFADNTLRSYAWALRDWQRFIDGRGHADPASWEPRDVEAWQAHLVDRELAATTRQLAGSALRSCLKWAARHDRAVRADLYLTVDKVKKPRLIPRPIPPADLDRILAHYAKLRPRAPLVWWRDRALFLYLLSTGARVNEALQLDADQLPQGAIVRQKGGGEKVLFTTDVAMGAIADYMRRRRDNHPALWITCISNRPVAALDPHGVRRIWVRLAAQLGITPFTTHQVRHTTATELMDAGVAPEVIAKHLGHKGLASLGGYAELRMGRRREAIDALERRIGSDMKQPGQRFVAVKGGRRRVDLA